MKKLLKTLFRSPLKLFLGFILLTILHNLFYAIFKIEEPVLFLLSLLSLLATIISITIKTIKLLSAFIKK